MNLTDPQKVTFSTSLCAYLHVHGSKLFSLKPSYRVHTYISLSKIQGHFKD